MSLINDALKKVEKSLNDNSQGEHFKQSMPPLDLEPSGPNKKLFFIALVGGTLFFSILILLLVLVFSDTFFTQSSTPAPTIKPSAPTFAAIVETEETKISQVEEPLPSSSAVEIPTNEIQFNNEMTNDSEKSSFELTTKEIPNSSPTTHSFADETSDTAQAQKNLNQEFFESILGLASKAFVTNASGQKKQNIPSNQSEESTPSAPKESYNLSTAQTTLETIEKESRKPKPVKAPETPIQKFIDSLSITGVMISNTDSMVLINNRVYLKDSIVDPNLNLKLIEINPQNIVLQSDLGTTYTVPF